jgi:glutamine amidotransferase-like uncharacterized protein
MRRAIRGIWCAVLTLTTLTSCRAGGSEAGLPRAATDDSILLFNGTGTSPGDVQSIEKILKDEHLTYSTIDSSQLNRISELQLRAYRLFIVPGGNFEIVGNSLTSAATATIRSAVQNGLNYLGICAGAFFAGNSPYNGLNLTSGIRFGFYAAESRGIRKTAVAITPAEGQMLDQYWEDGPQLSGWGDVVGKYPDGAPAIVEAAVGKGWVILTGIHAEAPEAWRRGMDFKTPAERDNAYAASLIHAALNREQIPHF